MDLPPVELVRTKNNHTQITSGAMHRFEVPPCTYWSCQAVFRRTRRGETPALVLYALKVAGSLERHPLTVPCYSSVPGTCEGPGHPCGTQSRLGLRKKVRQQRTYEMR